MSEFQTNIHIDMPNGVIGEIASGVATEGVSLIVTSNTISNSIGRAYTRVAGSDTECVAGNATGIGAFAGIAVLSKSYVGGDVEDGITLNVKQNTVIHLINRGAVFMYTGVCNIGDWVTFSDITGATGIISPGTSTPIMETLIEGARVVYRNPQTLMGVIKLIGT